MTQRCTIRKGTIRPSFWSMLDRACNMLRNCAITLFPCSIHYKLTHLMFPLSWK